MTIITQYVLILISFLVFLTISLLLTKTWHYFFQRVEKRKLIEKIQRGGIKSQASDTGHPFLPTRVMVQRRIMNFLISLGKRAVLIKSTDYFGTRTKFLRAGFRRENPAAVFWGTKCFLAICLPVIFFLVRITIFKLVSPAMTMAICTFLALSGFYLPDIYLRIRIAKRKEKLFEGFPDALDLLVVCVEAGMGLDAALNRVAEEIELSNKTLSGELKLLNLELRAGKMRGDALRDFAIRTDLEDVKGLVTLLIQTDKFGTSLAQALRVYSDSFRTKRYQKAEEIAAKLPVKLVLPLTVFIFPSLFVTIVGPVFIRVYQVFIQR
jgi:tight adherence protein C